MTRPASCARSRKSRTPQTETCNAECILQNAFCISHCALHVGSIGPIMITSALLVLTGTLAAAAPCESLKSLTLPDARITAAELVPAGPFTGPSPDAAPVSAGGRGQPSATDAAGRGRGRGSGA